MCNCFILVHVIFTRLYMFEYKFNNIVDVNCVLYSKNSILDVVISWSGRVSVLLVIGGSGRVGSGHRNGPVDIIGFTCAKRIDQSGYHARRQDCQCFYLISKVVYYVFI